MSNRSFLHSLLGIALIACACSEAETVPAKPVSAVSEEAKPEGLDLGLFKPALTDLTAVKQSPEQQAVVDLGRMLFYETALSSNDAISCNSCHLLDNFGVDGADFSRGVPGVPVGRNSPTVYNAFMHVAQFWDGRAADVEEQAKGPILAAKEMGMPNEEAVVAKLKGMAAYPSLFERAFPAEEPSLTHDSLTYDNVGKAIGAFERNLTTPGRWDEYLGGDADALSAEEVRGLQVFVETGCTTCHNGTLLGGTLYQKVGLVEPWPNQEDPGRFALTQNEADRMVFKVPSLRNIEKTGPYFHDSSALTLDEAVSKMARHQLGKPLDEKQRSAIVAFLSALTGDIPAAYIDPNRSDAGGSLHTQH